jgi:2-C-methyl-D-erythritol 2,4-cyclodiphosphate synthase
MIKVAIGQDSHRFGTDKPLILAGITIPEHQGFIANSDGDVILHALTNAISGITGKNILGKIADDMCKNGITNSAKYLEIALNDLTHLGFSVKHISISIECLTPKISHYMPQIRQSLANLLQISTNDIGITATTGEGLSDYGKGLGVFTTAILTVYSQI